MQWQIACVSGQVQIGIGSVAKKQFDAVRGIITLSSIEQRGMTVTVTSIHSFQPIYHTQTRIRLRALTAYH